jgi:diguanylate cyclase (GGDEF)-like protein
MEIKALLHRSETARLEALRELQILDTPIEDRFDRITRLAAKVFDVPICAISCIDQHRQWFKSIHGSNAVETARCISFCQHTIHEDSAFVIEDAKLDPRFADSPLVNGSNGERGIRFYAGIPIYARNGLPIAAFCLNGFEPRAFSEHQLDILKDIALIAQHTLQTPAPNKVEQELVENINESWRVSLIDPLTRLWNAEGVMAILDESISSKNLVQHGLCVSMIDLKKFGRINKALGQVGGDQVLRNFSSELLRELGDQDTIARLKNNTFLVIHQCMGNPSDGETVTQWLSSIADEFPIDGLECGESLGAHLSTVCVPHRWKGTSEDLMGMLENGMSQAKFGADGDASIVDASTGNSCASTGRSGLAA